MTPRARTRRSWTSRPRPPNPSPGRSLPIERRAEGPGARLLRPPTTQSRLALAVRTTGAARQIAERLQVLALFPRERRFLAPARAFPRERGDAVVQRLAVVGRAQGLRPRSVLRLAGIGREIEERL